MDLYGTYEAGFSCYCSHRHVLMMMIKIHGRRPSLFGSESLVLEDEGGLVDVWCDAF